MGSLVRERRSISWTDQTIDSLKPTPLPLMVFFGLVMMLMYLASYSAYQERVERSKMGLMFGLVLLPIAAILVMNMLMLRRRWWRSAVGVPRPVCDAVAEEEGNSGWVVFLVLVVILVLVKYHPIF